MPLTDGQEETSRAEKRSTEIVEVRGAPIVPLDEREATLAREQHTRAADIARQVLGFLSNVAQLALRIVEDRSVTPVESSQQPAAVQPERAPERPLGMQRGGPRQGGRQQRRRRRGARQDQ